MKHIHAVIKIILMISILVFGIQLTQVSGYQSLIELRNSSFWMVHLIVSLLTVTEYSFQVVISAIFDSLGILGISIIVFILVLMLDDEHRKEWIKWVGYYFIGLLVVVCSLLLWYSNNYYDNRLFLIIRVCGWFFVVYYGVGIVYLGIKNLKKVVIK